MGGLLEIKNVRHPVNTSQKRKLLKNNRKLSQLCTNIVTLFWGKVST